MVSGPRFPSRGVRSPKVGVACLLFLTLSWSNWLNTGMLQSTLTPVLQPLLILCLAIDAGWEVEGHVAH